MSFRFDSKKALHLLLFVIHSLGGAADLSRLFLILYLADLKHLAKYGSLISGDTYMAMNYGPVPFNILSITKQLKEGERTDRQKTYLGINDKLQAVALAPYDRNYLSASEVECLFETLQKYKAETLEALCMIVKAHAWNGADVNGEISLGDMAIESGATPQMIGYIKTRYSNEINSFNDVGKKT